MLCDSCKNKCICKHYEYIKNILINLTMQVTSCELYSGNSEVPSQSNVRPLYRQPLPSTIEDEEEDTVEEEERIFIDINNFENEPQSASIIDIFMKGDKNND